MQSAYILIKTNLGNQNDVHAKITKIKGVKSADAVMGPYDIITKIEGEDIASLGKMVISKIQNLNGIRDTLTCIVIKPV